jgi:three-Cys-motif partner protein
MKEKVFDEIGYWSEIKLDIIRKYAQAYSVILAKQEHFSHIYVDAFAGGGYHLSKIKHEYIAGSPLNALLVEPEYDEYHFIDIEQSKTESLRKLIHSHTRKAKVYDGDCNTILIDEIFPKIRYEDYRRGLCILDPYGLDLDWNVIEIAGKMKTIEIFLNFPVQDMNRNVLWRHPEKVSEIQKNRMNRFWGDESWRDIAYSSEQSLFGFEEKQDIETIAEAFRNRLIDKAGFRHVPQPIPMRNTKGTIVYYLFFASPKPVTMKIVKQIFDKYRNWRIEYVEDI